MNDAWKWGMVAIARATEIPVTDGCLPKDHGLPGHLVAEWSTVARAWCYRGTDRTTTCLGAEISAPGDGSRRFYVGIHKGGASGFARGFFTEGSFVGAGALTRAIDAFLVGLESLRWARSSMRSRDWGEP